MEVIVKNKSFSSSSSPSSSSSLTLVLVLFIYWSDVGFGHCAFEKRCIKDVYKDGRNFKV